MKAVVVQLEHSSGICLLRVQTHSHGTCSVMAFIKFGSGVAGVGRCGADCEPSHLTCSWCGSRACRVSMALWPQDRVYLEHACPLARVSLVLPVTRSRQKGAVTFVEFTIAHVDTVCSRKVLGAYICQTSDCLPTWECRQHVLPKRR
jgi:hypothetical protein